MGTAAPRPETATASRPTFQRNLTPPLETLGTILRIVLICFGLARGLLFCAYVWYRVGEPVPVWHYEYAFAGFAWRVQHGFALYPPWQDYPYVLNFFAPLYFWIVGFLGAAFGAGSEHLVHVGRWVTLACLAGCVAIVFEHCRRRHGVASACVGALFSFGSAAMGGYGVMVRPDMLALLLGLGGFMLSTSASWRWQIAGAALLGLAVLAKQNYGMYLMAAVLVPFVARDPWAAARLVATAAGVAASIVLAATLLGETGLCSALFSEGQFPVSLLSLQAALRRLLRLTPDLVVIPLLGLTCWWRGPHRDVRLALLTPLLLLVSVASTAKFGADLNYFLCLQITEGLAMGALWHRWTSADHRSKPGIATLLGLLAAASLTPGLPAHLLGALQSRAQHQFRWTAVGRQTLDVRRAIEALAADPAVKLLADSDQIAYYQGERAVFFDAQDFRMLVDADKIRPGRLLQMVESEHFDVIVLTANLTDPNYRSYYLRLPDAIAMAVRRHYDFNARAANYFIYLPATRPVSLTPRH
jgi:hypothetical protein